MGKKFIKKTTSVVLSVTTLGLLTGASALAPLVVLADHTTAHTIEQLQAQIVALSAQLAALSGGGGSAQCTFSRDLTVGSRGDDVTCLQNYLASKGHFTYSGGATGYFGSVTKNAVAAWQAANGISPAAGYLGPISRAKYSSMAVAPAPAPAPTPGVPSVPGVPAPVPAPAGTLRVDAGTHPAASLFPESAARVPFTVVKFTAPSNSDVTVSTMVVERAGLAQDAAIDGVVALDENGSQIGLSKTLNSSHQATLNEPIIIKAGTTRTITIGANAPATLDSYAGQVAYLSVVSVGSSLPVSGSLPITGAGHTVNASLVIGTVSSMARGSTDPGAAATKRLDTTNYTFAAVRATAGSAEKMYFKSIRWNQTGSAGVGDLANVKTYVEGTAYDTTVSSDGKYYTAVFGDNGGKGILVDKGFSKEISVKGDIVGGTSRTVAFDIAKRTDVNAVGENYGYGVIPPQTNSCSGTTGTSCFTSVEDPWYDAAVVTIGVGTILVSASSKSPAQNIAYNLANQPLGAFEVTVKGEQISVSRIGFNVTMISENASSDIDDITNVVITDESGAVIGGPKDGSASDSSNTTSSGDGEIVFTDTITFPVGTHVYYLKGKIGTDVANDTQVEASTTPSADFAGTVRGLVSGNTITPDPTSAITLSRMTVKTGALTISVSSVPIAQTAIAGSKAFLFANYILDAGSSGEDVRLATFPAEFNAPASSSAVSNCTLFDGATAVSDTVNPTAAASSSSFTLSGTGLVVPKGSAKTLGLKCDISSGASGTVQWGYDSSSNPTPTGVTSGQDVTEGENDSIGQRMTFATGGSVTVALDAGTPPYSVAAGGQTNVELSRIKFSASNEDVDLKAVALELVGAASNTPIDLVGRKVTLWDGSTQVGEAVFPTSDWATSSSVTNFRIPRDGSKVLIVKGDIASISNSGPLTASGDLLKVDWDGDNRGLNGTYGTGVSSGTTITPTGSDTASNGVRVFKSYPTFEKVNISSALINGEQAVLRWKVTANSAGDISVTKFTLRIATTSARADSLQVYAFSDAAFSVPAYNAINSTGQLMLNVGNFAGTAVPWRDSTTDLEAVVQDSAGATSTMQIPAGAIRYFEARVTMTEVDATGDSISTQLQGDAAYPELDFGGLSVHNNMASSSLTSISLSGPNRRIEPNNDFVWSPNSTTTAGIATVDWTNGFGITGLPSANMTSQVLSK